MAFYPGEQGGAALARLLLGRVSPSGKLPFTVPKDASQLPPFDNKSLTVEYGYYHGYTLAEKKGWEPRYPFGHGLSYTTFAYANLALDPNEAKADGVVHASVDVTNTGSRAGEEIVAALRRLPGLEGRPPGQAPARVREGRRSPPGETKRVAFTVPVKDLAYYDVGTKAWVVERTEYPVYVGPSSRQADLLTTSFRVPD